MSDTLHIAVACGGTGGHIFPGLATARVLRDRGHRVTLWLAGKDVESVAIEGWDGPVQTVRAVGLSFRPSWQSLQALYQLGKARRTCRRLMEAQRPDVLLAMGSFASYGPAKAAFALGVPVVLHEANVVPGRAITWLAPHARVVAGMFEETRFHFRALDLVITGMPLRREVTAALDLPDPRDPRQFTVLVMGGSRGAHCLNERVREAVCRHLPAAARARLQVIHLTGRADEDFVRAGYRDAGIAHEVHAFHADMGALYRRAHLAVCRAGAATCAELMAFGLPSLLVPYPTAVRNHQLANARAMEKYGAADMVEEKDLEAEWLAEYLDGMMRAPTRLARLGAAARQRGRTRAADELADLTERVARSGPGED